MIRNGGLLLTAAALSLALLPEPSAGQIVQVPGERPNVIVVVTDDQREGLEVMPSTRRLFVDEGIDFPNAFVTTPLCCPARASIMTGQYVHNHGVLSNGEDAWRELDESNTIQAKLDAEGYRTGLFGKFLNHWPTSRVPQHFDEWWLLPDVVGRTGYYGATWNINGTLQKVNTYSTTYLRSKAVEFIEAGESADDEPFYMYIAVAAAHRSFVPEPRYEGASVPRWRGNPAVFETNKRDKPAYVRNSDFTFKEGKKRRAAQLRTLMSVDDMIEGIHAALEAGGEEDTLVIFVSDSGYLWGEHGLTNKQVPYGESIRMPMMLRWPGHGPEDDSRLVTNVDIAPTIYAATGVTAATDGRDLLDTSWDRDRIHLEYFGDPNAPAIPRWASTWTPSGQYVEYYGPGSTVGFIEYYDLLDDPWQLRNTKAAPNDTWATRLRADRSCSGASCP
ncbi:MAG: sulfatase [Actinomycetota bacterium]|nr:sulfatase [Actinomycetota bacterium]